MCSYILLDLPFAFTLVEPALFFVADFTLLSLLMVVVFLLPVVDVIAAHPVPISSSIVHNIFLR